MNNFRIISWVFLAAFTNCLISLAGSQFPFSGRAVLDGQPLDGIFRFSFSLADRNGSVHWQSGTEANSSIRVSIENGDYLVLLGGQGMNPIEPGILLDHSDLRIRVFIEGLDETGEKQFISEKRLLASPHVLAAELANLADRAILAEGLAEGSLTIEKLTPAFREKIVRASDPNQLEAVFQSYFAERYRPQIQGGSVSKLLVKEGESVSFLPTVIGNGLSFQWKKNGEILAGQILAELNATASVGDRYSLVATNLFGTDVKTFTLSEKIVIPPFNPSMIQRNRFSVSQHTMWIDENGSLWGVGSNGAGRLGDGSDIHRSKAVKVVEEGVASVEVRDHSLFIKENGSLWAMGGNYGGRLGDGTKIVRKSPVRVMDSDVIAVSPGQNHTLCLKHDGSLWAVGVNGNGQLGNGSTEDSLSWVQVMESGVTQISAGNSYSLFIKKDGSLWGFGSDEFGRFGLGENGISHLFPVKIIDSGVVEVSAGNSHSVFLKSDGSAWAMGNNSDGQLGDGTRETRYRPVMIFDRNVTKVYADSFNSYFLKNNGTLFGVGANSKANLAISPSPSQVKPIMVAEQVISASVGGETVLYLGGDSVLRGHGKTDTNQLNVGGELFSHLFHFVEEGNVTQISTKHKHSLYRKSDGSLWALGQDNNGKLGDGASWTSRSSPVRVVSGNVTDLSAGTEHSLFVKSDGSLWGMGSNTNKRINESDTPFYSTPELILEANVSICTTGNCHSLFVKTDGSLWSMGRNLNGQLGIGTLDNQFKPMLIVPANVTAVAAGNNFSVFMQSDGSVWSMGSNQNGKLGYGGLGDRNLPVRVMTSGAAKIAVGHNHSLILKSDGSLWVFGAKGNGKLGELNKSDRRTPLKVMEEGVVAIAAGGNHSLFVKSDGTLWSMGNNNKGQLGIDKSEVAWKGQPFRVMDSGAAEVAAGTNHSMILRRDGALITFGEDVQGIRGSGRLVWTSEAVTVASSL